MLVPYLAQSQPLLSMRPAMRILCWTASIGIAQNGLHAGMHLCHCRILDRAIAAPGAVSPGRTGEAERCYVVPRCKQSKVGRHGNVIQRSLQAQLAAGCQALICQES